MPRLVAIVALALLAFAGCGEDESEPASTQPAAKDSADLSGIKSYLTDHTDALTAQTAILKENGQAYYDLAKESNFDYEAMLSENPVSQVAAAGFVIGSYFLAERMRKPGRRSAPAPASTSAGRLASNGANGRNQEEPAPELESQRR